MLTKLASTQRLESVSKLYENHIQEFLEKLKVSSTTLGYAEVETHCKTRHTSFFFKNNLTSGAMYSVDRYLSV